MNDILKMYIKIEKNPNLYLADKRVDYLFEYWLGCYVVESYYKGQIFYSEVPNWIYKSLLRNGYDVDFSYSWYKMLYLAMNNDEELAWKYFFAYIYTYIYMQIDKCEQNIKTKKLDIKKMIHLVYYRPGIATGSKQKRIDYVSHYFAGIYSKEDENFNSKEFEQITQYIYTYLVSKGYSIEKSKWWHKMINQITTDEDEAWELLFEGLIKCFEQK